MPQSIISLSGSTTELDQLLIRGIAWTGTIKWLSQILVWVSTLIVVRLLTPADYGLVSMATISLGFVALINELGLGAAIVTKHDLTEVQIAQLNGLCVLLGVVAFAVACLAAVPISFFFGKQELRWVVLVLSACLVISAFRTVPSALLERELQFKLLALIEGVQAIMQSLSMVILALFGLRYWALVLPALLGTLLWTIMTLSWRSHAIAWPHFQSLKETITFSGHLLISRVSWYVQSYADFLVVGRVFGQEALGVYTIAKTIASLPIDRITSLVGRISFPLFAALQHDATALRRYLLGLTEGLALITFALALGLALVADDFVPLALGEQWQGTIGPLRPLALFIMFQAISPLITHLLNVIGESRFCMRTGVVAGVVLPISFYFGSHWGIVGIAAIWVTVRPLVILPLYWRLFRKIGLSTEAYLKALWPALSGALLLVIAVWTVKQTIPQAWPLAVSFSLQVLAGGAGYTLAAVTLHRGRLRLFYHTLRRARRSAR